MEIEALASIMDYATQKDIVERDEIKEAEVRLDRILTNLERNQKFFKRLL